MRIVEPSAREAHYNRGNLYVLLELMGESPARNRILRQLLNDLQQTYYTAKGSQSTVLTATLQSAHRSLQQLRRDLVQRNANPQMVAERISFGLRDAVG